MHIPQMEKVPVLPPVKPKGRKEFTERVAIHVLDGLFSAFGKDIDLANIGTMVWAITDDIIKKRQTKIKPIS